MPKAAPDFALDSAAPVGESTITAWPRLCLVLLCLALWLPGFFTLPPTDRDESRFAQATRQMLQTGDFVRIMNGAEPRNRKPIGIHWLQAPFAEAAAQAGIATANPIWPYRIPSLLGGIAAVLATYSLGLTLLANRRAAFLAAALLAGCVILTVEAHIAKTDAALLGATTIAMAVLARAWTGARLKLPEAMLFWVALGAGILIKGPITPLVVGASTAACGLTAGRWSWLRPLRPLAGGVVLLAVILPWFIAIGLATHGAFFADSVGGDLGRKLAGGSESHGAPPGLHALLLPLLVFPATLPVLCGLGTAWGHRRETATRFLLCWLVPAWLLFEAVPTKLPHYTLPLYPALMLLAAAWLMRPTAPRWLTLAGQTLTLVAATILGIGALALPLLLLEAWWLGVPALAAAALVGWLAVRQRLLPALLAGILLYASILQLELPALSRVWLAPRIVALLRAQGELPANGEGLVSTGFAEPSLMFLAGTDIVWSPTGDAAAVELARHSHGVALVTADNVAGFESRIARLGLSVRWLGAVKGFNPARGKTIVVTVFARDGAS
jgi:4-amino-4-deoxy-L-arabinose transferase-like glycosyltransferase